MTRKLVHIEEYKYWVGGFIFMNISTEFEHCLEYPLFDYSRNIKIKMLIEKKFCTILYICSYNCGKDSSAFMMYLLNKKKYGCSISAWRDTLLGQIGDNIIHYYN